MLNPASDSISEKKEFIFYLNLFENRLRFLEQERYKLITSYFTLRTIVGLLGMCLPFVVALGGMTFFDIPLQSSVSAYYYTGMRDVLVGTLWAIAFFLFSYKGYDLTDEIAGKLCFLFAIGVSVFPTSPDGATDPHVLLIGFIHLVCAALLFITLTFYAIFLFTKTNPDVSPTRRKIQRNIIYLICGLLMTLSILLMAALSLLPSAFTAALSAYQPVFWLEALAVFAFGISWFVKGKAILRDED